MLYKKLEIADMPALRDLYFQEESLKYDCNKTKSFDERICKVYSEMLSRGSYILGWFDTIDNMLVGAITVNKCLDCYPGYESNPYVHLETFIVHKEYQNKGIGTELLKKAIDFVISDGCTYILMQSHNPAVIHIAKKVGLTESLTDMRKDLVQESL